MFLERFNEWVETGMLQQISFQEGNLLLSLLARVLLIHHKYNDVKYSKLLITYSGRAILNFKAYLIQISQCCHHTDTVSLFTLKIHGPVSRKRVLWL